MKTFEEFCKARGLMDDAQDIAFCVSDYLYEMAKDVDAHEPYATNAIQKYREAERIVALDLYSYEPYEKETES